MLAWLAWVYISTECTVIVHVTQRHQYTECTRHVSVV